ncbi:MAG: ABC transporter substrate-binding protein, partial [Persicimonas sp.]
GESGARIVSRDTEGTPQGAAKAVRELAADDSVVAILGPIGRRESRPAAQIAQRAGVPMMTLASSDSVNRVGGWVFRLRQTPAEQAEALAEAVREHLSDKKRAAVLFPESNYGREAALAFARRFRDLDGRITAVASYEEDTTDFRKALDVLVGKRVLVDPRARIGTKRADRDGYYTIRSQPTVDFDLLFVPDFHVRVARLLRFFPDAGIQTGAGGEGTAVQMLGLSGWQGSSMKLTGAHAAGALYSDIFVGEGDGGRAEDFARVFEGETGRRPVDLDAQVFDAAWLMGQILQKIVEKQRSSDQRGSAEELRSFFIQKLPSKPNFTGVSGRFGFGPRGEPLRPLRLYEFDIDGEVSPWN